MTLWESPTRFYIRADPAHLPPLVLWQVVEIAGQVPASLNGRFRVIARDGQGFECERVEEAYEL